MLMVFHVRDHCCIINFQSCKCPWSIWTRGNCFFFLLWLAWVNNMAHGQVTRQTFLPSDHPRPLSRIWKVSYANFRWVGLNDKAGLLFLVWHHIICIKRECWVSLDIPTIICVLLFVHLGVFRENGNYCRSNRSRHADRRSGVRMLHPLQGAAVLGHRLHARAVVRAHLSFPGGHCCRDWQERFHARQ